MMDLGYIRSAGWLLLARDLFPYLLSIVYRWMHVFVSIVIDVTEYDSQPERNPEGCILVAKTITERATLKWGKRILHDKLGFAIHDTMIGKWFWATMDINRRGYSEDLCITVYTFRWHKPIITDEEAASKLPSGKMWEAINLSTSLDGHGRPDRQREAVDLDTRKCPESVKTTALQVVKIIEESECGSILIQGPPGVGKTYTARLFNSMNKNAMLCPDFNPLSGETPNSVYDDLGCQRDKLIVVLVINEVEEVIKKMGNKSEWNNLLDLVNNSPHMFKLIMTTNVPLEQLIKKDISLLRDGRVAKLELEVQDDMDVRVRMVSDADLLARSTPDEPDEPDEADEAAKPISRRRAFAKLIRAGFHRSR
jgi:hypothetical protein